MQVCVVWVCCGSGQVCRCVLWMWTRCRCGCVVVWMRMYVGVCCGCEEYADWCCV